LTQKYLKWIQHRIEYLFLRGVIPFIWKVSLKNALNMGDFLGWFIFSVLRIRRHVTITNLTMAFPEKSLRELKTIALSTYQNFAKLIFEFIRFPKLDRETLLSYCIMDHPEYLDQALKKGKGVILAAGHFGNWEIMAPLIVQMGYPINSVIAEQHNSLTDKIINEYRTMMGNRLISMGIAVRGVIRALRNNECVGLLVDQDAGADGIFIDFFNRKASTYPGPASLALKMGSPIIFGTPIRMPRGKHRIESRILCFDHLKETTPENIKKITQIIAQLLENAIRAHPDHWFWMHKRWKTRPPSMTEEADD